MQLPKDALLQLPLVCYPTVPLRICRLLVLWLQSPGNSCQLCLRCDIPSRSAGYFGRCPANLMFCCSSGCACRRIVNGSSCPPSTVCGELLLVACETTSDTSAVKDMPPVVAGRWLFASKKQER